MIKIEPVAERDLPELAVLYRELSGNEQLVDKMRNSFINIKADDAYILLGAKIGHRLAGSVMGIVCHDMVDDCRPFMVIENVIVSKEFRNRGVGRALMERIEEFCVIRNCYYSMFVSGIKRTGAHRFYESIGYKADMVKGFKKFF